MKSLPLLLLLPAWWLAVAAATPVRTPTPAPTPTPSSGVLSLTPVEGQPGITVTITGSQFFPNEQVVVYLDTNQRPLLTTQADAQGGFKGDATIPDIAAGDHQACVAESPAPRCATLRILLKSTPTPEPTATPSAAVSAGPTSLATSPPAVSPVAILLEPPFVFFPALLLLAAIGGSVFWIVQGRRRPTPVLPAARVMHRSAQLDEEPPVPPPAQADPAPPGDLEAAPEPPAPSPPRPRPPVADERSDLPEPGD